MSEVISSFRSLRTGSQVFALLMLFLCVILHNMPIITTINIRHTYRLQQNRRTFTNCKNADCTQFTEAQTTIHTANIICTNIILAEKHNLPKGKMHSNCRLLPDHIVCKITHRNNIMRAASVILLSSKYSPMLSLKSRKLSTNG